VPRFCPRRMYITAEANYPHTPQGCNDRAQPGACGVDTQIHGKDGHQQNGNRIGKSTRLQTDARGRRAENAQQHRRFLPAAFLTMFPQHEPATRAVNRNHASDPPHQGDCPYRYRHTDKTNKQKCQEEAITCRTFRMKRIQIFAYPDMCGARLPLRQRSVSVRDSSKPSHRAAILLRGCSRPVHRQARPGGGASASHRKGNHQRDCYFSPRSAANCPVVAMARTRPPAGKPCAASTQKFGGALATKSSPRRIPSVSDSIVFYFPLKFATLRERLNVHQMVCTARGHSKRSRKEHQDEQQQRRKVHRIFRADPLP
jgi:hypothetical protein